MKQALPRILLLLGALLAAAPGWAQEGGERVLTIACTREHPRNSEGSFVTLKSGRILFVYSQFYGGESDFSAARLAEMHSDDQGRTWRGPSTVLENGSDISLMCTGLLRLMSGKIMLLYDLKKTEIDCHPYFRLSSDEGRSWSEPRIVNESFGYIELCNDRLMQTARGRIVVPMGFYRIMRPVNNGFTSVDTRGIMTWYYSDDDGQNWSESPTWWTLPSIIPAEVHRTVHGTSELTDLWDEPGYHPAGKISLNGLEEAGTVEIADGSLFTWARTDLGMLFGLRSRDGGYTWTAPEPTELKSPFAPANMKRVPGSGDVLAVWDDHSGRFPFPDDVGWGRAPLVVGLSHDGARTFPVRRLLEGDVKGQYAYPAIHFVADQVLVAYSAEPKDQVGHLGELRIKRFPLSWLAGSPR